MKPTALSMQVQRVCHDTLPQFISFSLGKERRTMRPNRSIPDTTVIPELAYNDVVTAAKWLCDTFGFQKRLQIGSHRIQLLVGTGAIVVTERAPSLRQVDFAHSVLVRVENVDQHCTTAMAAGARIIRQPQSYPFGEKQYTVEDFEGHIWTFSQTIDDIDPASWGGILHRQ